MHRITAVKVLEGYRLELTFQDGARGVVDLSDLTGKGVFSAWSERSFFANVRMGSFGELVWGDRIDLCPDSLYLRMTGKKPREIFPSLKDQTVHA